MVIATQQVLVCGWRNCELPTDEVLDGVLRQLLRTGRALNAWRITRRGTSLMFR